MQINMQKFSFFKFLRECDGPIEYLWALLLRVWHESPKGSCLRTNQPSKLLPLALLKNKKKMAQMIYTKFNEQKRNLLIY